MTWNFEVGAHVARGAAVALLAVASTNAAYADNRPVMLLETAITTFEEREIFVRDTAPEVTPSTRSYFGRLFANLLPAKRYSKPKPAKQIATGTIGQSPVRIAQMTTPGDPNFKRWEADAQQRLKHENTAVDSKPHPLAAQHPESFVTVCEAGCIPKTDQIVYMVSRKEAANAQPRGFVPSSADATAEASAKTSETPNGAATEPLDPDAIDCVAGCYKGPKSMRAHPDRSGSETPKRRADIDRQRDPVKAIQQSDRRIALTPSPDPSVAIKTALVRERVQRIAKLLAKKPVWQTKIVRENSLTPQIKNKPTSGETRAETALTAKGKWKTNVSRSSRISMLSKKR